MDVPLIVQILCPIKPQIMALDTDIFSKIVTRIWPNNLTLSTLE